MPMCGNELSRQRTVPGLVVQHRTSIGVSGDFFNKGDPEPFAIYWPLDHEKRRVIAPGRKPGPPREPGWMSHNG